MGHRKALALHGMRNLYNQTASHLYTFYYALQNCGDRAVTIEIHSPKLQLKLQRELCKLLSWKQIHEKHYVCPGQSNINDQLAENLLQKALKKYIIVWKAQLFIHYTVESDPFILVQYQQANFP